MIVLLLYLLLSTLYYRTILCNGILLSDKYIVSLKQPIYASLDLTQNNNICSQQQSYNRSSTTITASSVGYHHTLYYNVCLFREFTVDNTLHIEQQFDNNIIVDYYELKTLNKTYKVYSNDKQQYSLHGIGYFMSQPIDLEVASTHKHASWTNISIRLNNLHKTCKTNKKVMQCNIPLPIHLRYQSSVSYQYNSNHTTYKFVTIQQPNIYQIEYIDPSFIDLIGYNTSQVAERNIIISSNYAIMSEYKTIQLQVPVGNTDDIYIVYSTAVVVSLVSSLYIGYIMLGQTSNANIIKIE